MSSKTNSYIANAIEMYSLANTYLPLFYYTYASSRFVFLAFLLNLISIIYLNIAPVLETCLLSLLFFQRITIVQRYFYFTHYLVHHRYTSVLIL